MFGKKNKKLKEIKVIKKQLENIQKGYDKNRNDSSIVTLMRNVNFKFKTILEVEDSEQENIINDFSETLKRNNEAIETELKKAKLEQGMDSNLPQKINAIQNKTFPEEKQIIISFVERVHAQASIIDYEKKIKECLSKNKNIKEVPEYIREMIKILHNNLGINDSWYDEYYKQFILGIKQDMEVSQAEINQINQELKTKKAEAIKNNSQAEFNTFSQSKELEKARINNEYYENTKKRVQLFFDKIRTSIFKRRN